jgi:hypothetical protein
MPGSIGPTRRGQADDDRSDERDAQPDEQTARHPLAEEEAREYAEEDRAGVHEH